MPIYKQLFAPKTGIVARFEKMRKAFSIIKKSIYYTVMVLVCFEIALWIIGYRPYSNHDYKVEASPDNAFVGHEIYGVWNNPGNYEITLNDHIQFQARHNLNGQRYIPPTSSDSILGKVAFLGCSFTYGYGVNDNETFVSNLQNRFPKWEMMNMGTPGFGTVQSYLQLKELIKKDSVKVVVLCFSSFHFMRNVMSQEYRSNLKIGFKNSSKSVDARMEVAKFPFIKDQSLKVEYENWDALYANYFLREHSATSNWLQNNVNKFKDRNLMSIEITGTIIQRMSEICFDNQIDFRLVCLDNSDEVEELQENWGQKYSKNINFDFKNVKITNLPYDSHPNAKGHALIASKIGPLLTSILEKGE